MHNERPEEIANLLNPAFCGEIIRRCIKKFYEVSEEKFDFALIYLILPIVLHRGTRDKISPYSRKQMHVWLQENQEVRINFNLRAQQLVPFTKEAVIFLMQTNSLVIQEDGKIVIPSYKKMSTKDHSRTEISDIFRKSEIIGRWFANAGTSTTIYTMWGVKP